MVERRTARVTETPEQSLKERLKIRSHNAIVEGRILPTETPVFIGTWRPSNPSVGLFEIYLDQPIKDGEFQGKIEDNLGTATVRGRISEEEVVFIKSYVESQSSENANRTMIIYKGVRKGHEYYLGKWYAVIDRIDINQPLRCLPKRAWQSGDFELKRFSDSDSKNPPYRSKPEQLGWAFDLI